MLNSSSYAGRSEIANIANISNSLLLLYLTKYSFILYILKICDVWHLCYCVKNLLQLLWINFDRYYSVSGGRSDKNGLFRHYLAKYHFILYILKNLRGSATGKLFKESFKVGLDKFLSLLFCQCW